MLPYAMALSATALAHVGAPIDAVDIHAVDEIGRALEASVGLAWTEDGDDWRWVCHEAITTPDAVITPQYAIAGRHWLATVPRMAESRTEADAVYWTDDGCTWTMAEGLHGHEVPAVALDSDGTIALAVSGDPDSHNTIFRSTDGGRTFASVLSVPDQLLTSVVIAKGTADTAMVGGFDADGTGWLHWSRDLGETWSSAAVTEGEVVAMALHPTNPDVGYAVIDGVGVETLLYTDDGGASVDVLIDPEGFISDVAVGADDQAWVAFGGTAFLHAADGVTFELATEAPPGLGVGLHGDRVMLATRFEMVNSALAEGTRADGFEPVFTFMAFDGPMDCPAGTHGAEVCDGLFPLLQESLGLVDLDDTGDPGSGDDGGDAGSGTGDTPTTDSGAPAEGTSTDTDKSGCGKGAWLLLVPLLGLAGVRSRRPGDR